MGGWESGVTQARLAEQWAALLTVSEGRERVVVRSLTGTEAWSLVLDSHSSQTLTVEDTEVILLQPGFTDPDFTPIVTTERYELEDGSNLGTTTITLQPADNVRIEGGFCFTAEWGEEALVCDQTYGGPLRIDISGTIDFLGDYDQGVATAPRVAP